MNGAVENSLLPALLAAFARLLEIDAAEINPDLPFERYGISSLEMAAYIGELERLSGQPVSPVDLYFYPTLRSLADHLTGAECVDSLSESKSAEPVAIIGIGCRFPMASGPAAFWRVLTGGVDAVRTMPRSRPGAEAFYQMVRSDARLGMILVGGFLDDVERFDAEFFNLSRREACAIDPQQRLLLEVAWEAFDDAGLLSAGLPRDTGVFVGIANADYARVFPDILLCEPQGTLGNALSIAANRISYSFDLRGPSMAIDTACSSSLVAVHMACEALRNDSCSTAIAAGVNLILSPDVSVGLARAGFLSPSGRCRTFDAEADGYVRGEGAAAVVLKPLSDALRDGDAVYAVIRGSAANNDGRSNGLAAPNGRAQEEVIRHAARNARISPREVDYVELHGTGTVLGDPVEACALSASLLRGRCAEMPCLVGSVKTNIGHLEAAAGIAGLVKAALVIRHRAVPPSLHCVRANPHIAAADLPLAVPDGVVRLAADRHLIAAVSSFGFGGTNAHVILSTASLPEPPEAEAEGPYTVVLSARTREGLRVVAGELLASLDERPEALPELAYSTSWRRLHGEIKLALTVHDLPELAASLAARARANLADHDVTGEVDASNATPATAGVRHCLELPIRGWRHQPYWYGDDAPIEEELDSALLSPGAALARVCELIQARTGAQAATIECLVARARDPEPGSGTRRYHLCITLRNPAIYAFRVDEAGLHMGVWRELCHGVVQLQQAVFRPHSSLYRTLMLPEDIAARFGAGTRIACRPGPQPQIAEIYARAGEVLTRLEPRPDHAVADMIDLVLDAVHLSAQADGLSVRIINAPASPPAADQIWVHLRISSDPLDGTVEANITLYGGRAATLGISTPEMSMPNLPMLRLDWIPEPAQDNDFVGRETCVYVVCSTDAKARLRLCERLRARGREARTCEDPAELLDLGRPSEPSTASTELVLLVPSGTWDGATSPPAYAAAVLSYVHDAARRATAAGGSVRVSVVVTEPDACTGNECGLLSEALLRSYLRVLGHEHPTVAGKCIFCPEGDDALDRLTVELLAGRTDPHVRLGESRRVPRLRPIAPEPAQHYKWRSDRSYLVVGGSGGIGQALVRRALERGAQHIAIVGRSTSPAQPSLRDLLEEGAIRGAKIHCAAFDVSDPEALRNFLVRYNGPPFAGVFHLATVAESGAIESLDGDAFARVLEPKAIGAWNLHKEFGDSELDAFVLFSSLAGLLGFYGQGAAHYAAANGFLDELARLRRYSHKAALSIAWGSWREVGLTSAPEFATRFAAQGERTLSTRRALDAMERLMISDEPTAVVADLDWRIITARGLGDADCATLRELGGGGWERSVGAAAPAGGSPPELSVRALLRRVISDALQTAPEAIDEKKPLTELGVDSLLLLEIRGRIERELRLVIPVADLLDGASVASLTRIIEYAIQGR